MKKITLILVFILNTVAYSQNTEYINDFGNLLSKVEFPKLKKNGWVVVQLKDNKDFKKGIIPIEYNGQISDSLKSELINFLESNINFKIKKTDKIIEYP